MFISKGYKGIYDLYFINPETGKRTKVSTGKSSKKSALKFLSNFIAQGSSSSKNKTITFLNFSKELIEYVGSNFTSKTICVYKLAIKNLIKVLGDKDLRLYSAKDFECYKSIRSNEVSKTSVNIEIRTIKAIFNYAIKMEYLNTNPLKYVNQIKIPQKEILSFSDIELRVLLKSIDDIYFKSLILFALYTGCRLNEILNIQLKDINLNDMTLVIRNKVDFKVKTGKIRYIPISNQLHEQILSIFDYHKVTKISFDPEKYLFSNNFQRKYVTNFVSKKFKRYLRKAGLPEKYHFHCLRHTFITNLIKNDVNINYIKQLAGHSDIKTTMGYIHLQTEDLRDAMNRYRLVM